MGTPVTLTDELGRPINSTTLLPVDTELPAAAALADGAAVTPTTPTIGAIPLVMNATTADRQRAVVAALDSVGTGIAAAGIVGQFDDAATAAVTENQFAPVRISTRRALLTEGVASGTPINVSDATVNITVSVTLTVGATYAAADFVGTSSTPISFANAVRTSGGSATLRAVTISDPAASVAAVLELWLFNATVTPPADSAAWSLSDADGLKCVGILSIPTTSQFLSSVTGVLHLNNLQLQYHCAATTLFGALVTRGAPTYTGTLQVMLEIEYDQ